MRVLMVMFFPLPVCSVFHPSVGAIFHSMSVVSLKINATLDSPFFCP